jgi:hypothetical protein
MKNAMTKKYTTDKMRFTVAVMLTLAMVSASILTEAGTQDVYAESSTLSPNVQRHTKAEIVKYYSSHKFSFDTGVTYAAKPKTTAPYKLGALSKKSLKNGLNALNVYRYIAGVIPVKLSDNANKDAQAAAVVNAANAEVEHFPKKPKGMSESFFKLAAAGAASSNVGGGAPSDTVANNVAAYISDWHNAERNAVGHRSSGLAPTAIFVGFGLAEHKYAKDDKDPYDAMKIVASGSGTSPYNGVAWPAQNMPTELQGMTTGGGYWSFNTGDVDMVGLAPESAKISIIRMRHNEKKRFQATNLSKDKNPEIVFDFNGAMTPKAGDKYEVIIKVKYLPYAGLGVGRPEVETISYTVSFFSLGKEIIKGKMTGVKYKAGKKKIAVSWKKKSGATGYKITYAKNKKMTSGKKTITIKSGKTTKKTIKGLKKGKYYIKIRAYTKIYYDTSYSPWSAVKRVKVK